jgi:hypothetical protein
LAKHSGVSAEETAMTNSTDEPAGLDFLDFLFTVAISVGLTPEVLQIPDVSGFLSEKWQKSGRWPSTDESFNIGVYLLGFFNLTLSWFGYHTSIKARPLNYFSGYGMTRFILDVLLIIMYGIILIKYRSFNVAISLLLIIYFIFAIWDYLRVCEYWENKYRDKPGTKLQRYRREWVSLFAFGIVAEIALLYFCVSCKSMVCTSFCPLYTVFYRINKNYATWEKLLGWKENV